MWPQALTLLEAMKLAGKEISPDVVSYNTTLKACGGAGQLDQAIEVRPECRPLHASLLQFGATKSCPAFLCPPRSSPSSWFHQDSWASACF